MATWCARLRWHLFRLAPATSEPVSVISEYTTSVNIYTEVRSCVKVEVDVLGSPCLLVGTVSVDVKQH